MSTAKCFRHSKLGNAEHHVAIRRWVFAIAAVGLSIFCDGASAATIVAPDIYTGTDALADTVVPFEGFDEAVIFQWIVPAANFSTVPIGSQIASIGFRMDANFPAAEVDAVFSRWDLQLSNRSGSSLTLDTTFAANIGPDVVTVRSGPLVVPANAIQAGPGPNPFYDIPFDTPYTYTGGSVVLTLTHSGHPGAENLIQVDGVGVASGLGDTVCSFSMSSPTGVAHFFNFPVVQFTFVPEPALAVLAIVGLALGFACARRRKLPIF